MKGLAMETIANLAKLVGAAILIVGIIVTSLQPAIQDILSDINPDQSQGVDLSIKDHYDLAGAAKLTMDRATECTIVAERTYQDLAGTEIGQKPECSRTILPAPPLRDRAPEAAEQDGFGAVTGPGNDVEGVDGKLTFNITKSGGIILRSKGVQNQGPQELGAELVSEDVTGYGTPVDGRIGGYSAKGGPLKLFGVSTRPYNNIVKSESTCSGDFESPSSFGDPRNYGFILTFENPPEGVDNRVSFGEDAFDLKQSSDNGVFCTEGGGGAVQVSAGLSRVKLCKGDRGYIQVNKGEPTGNAQREDPEGGSATFGYIQITDAVDNCNIDRNLRPFPSQTEHGGSVSGDTLRLELNKDNYPGVTTKSGGKAFDLVESENAGDIARFSYEDEVPPNECSVSLRERQTFVAGSPSDGWINYPSGTQIPSVGGFPAQSNAVRVSEDFFGSSESEEVRRQRGRSVTIGGDTSDSRAAKLYSKLSSDGLTKASINAQGDLLVSTDQTDQSAKFEMYGPLACGKDGGQESRWHLCVTKGSDAAGTRGKELNTDADPETELKCTESGWESQNPRNAGQETPDSILEPSLTPKYPEVFYTEGDKARFLPAQSAGADDYLVWEDNPRVPDGAKEVRINMSFKKRGHLQIDLQREATGSRTQASETTTYINTDADGNEHVYAQTPDGYSDTEVNYPVNQEFTIVVERSRAERGRFKTSWSLETGENSQQLISSQDTPDFSRIVLESWSREESPKVDIHSFSVTEIE